MKQRIITAAVGISLCIAVLILGAFFPIVISIAMSLLSAAMVFEYLHAGSLFKNYGVLITCLLFSLIMPLTVNTAFRLIPIYLFSVILFTVMIISHKTVSFNKLAFAYAGTLMISLSISSISVLAFKTYSIYYIIVALAVPWLADAGAYFIGTFFGKTKLCPDISPKKTVEGAVGGLLTGIVGGLLISVIFQFIVYKSVSVNYLLVLLVSVLSSVISIIGDLTFSLIKRSCGLKDFGSIMPGHGGFCDRFDSVIFCAPLVMIFSISFPLMFPAV